MEPNLQPNPLETDPIPKLIVRYAVPTSLTLMVNYLYNIVDQIFVGQGVGITGMAATCKEFCGNCYTESEYIYVNKLGIPYKPNFVSTISSGS